MTSCLKYFTNYACSLGMDESEPVKSAYLAKCRFPDFVAGFQACTVSPSAQGKSSRMRLFEGAN